MTGSAEIEQIIRDLHYRGQVVRDRWFEAYEVALGRLRLTLLEAESFGRDFSHLIPQQQFPMDVDRRGVNVPPLPDVPSHSDGIDEAIRRWQDTFGRMPGEGQ